MSNLDKWNKLTELLDEIETVNQGYEDACEDGDGGYNYYHIIDEFQAKDVRAEIDAIIKEILNLN